MVRVYVNGRGVDVRATATALDAVRAAEPAAADRVESGERVVVDSRGLWLDAATPVHGGAIFRVVSARQRGTPGDA